MKKAKISYLQIWTDSVDGRNDCDVILFFKLLKLDRLEKDIRDRMNPVRSLAFNNKLLFLTKTIEKIWLFLKVLTRLSKNSKLIES